MVVPIDWIPLVFFGPGLRGLRNLGACIASLGRSSDRDKVRRSQNGGTQTRSSSCDIVTCMLCLEK